MLTQLVFQGTGSLFIPCPVLRFNRLIFSPGSVQKEHLQRQFSLSCSLFPMLFPSSKMDVLQLHALTCSESWPWNSFMWNSFLHKPRVIKQGSAANSNACIWRDLFMLSINMTHQSWAMDVDQRKLLIYRVSPLGEPGQRCQLKNCDPIMEFRVLNCVPLEWTWGTRGWAHCDSGGTLQPQGRGDWPVGPARYLQRG